MPRHASDAPARPLVIGHRGASGLRPEHTESAYRLALAAGVDAVEPDIVASSDSVLVVRHENEISGTTDVADRPEFAGRRTTKNVDGEKVTGWFTEDFTWAELATLRARERVPRLRPDNTAFDGAEPILRLRDVLAIVDDESERQGRDIAVVIEVKHAHFLGERGHDLVELLLAELRECGWADRPGRLIVESFELAPLDRLRESGLQTMLVFLLEHEGAPADERAKRGRKARSYAWYRGDEGLDGLAGRVDGISLSKIDVLADPGIVARAHARGLGVFVWTLRPENRFLDRSARSRGEHSEWGDWQAEWRRIVQSGVDGVFVDHPELGVALRDGLPTAEPRGSTS
jgi:glycerophosphoryl diester phosphodiesterase